MDFDLDAYLKRIGYDGDRTPTFATLKALQRAHIFAIAFENLDPMNGRAPSLAIPDLMDKLVVGTTRGGYCYEHNTLYATALRALGYRVTLLTARVRAGMKPGDLRPRSHMLMLAEAPGDPTRYLTDVGFGSEGALLDPVPLAVTEEIDDAPRRHRLTLGEHDGPLDLWVLQAFLDGEWRDQYAFTIEPFYAPDYEVINWNTGTNPRSPFTQRIYAIRTFPDRLLLLDAKKLTETRTDGTRTVRELADDAEVRRVLAEEFGIHLSE